MVRGKSFTKFKAVKGKVWNFYSSFPSAPRVPRGLFIFFVSFVANSHIQPRSEKATHSPSPTTI